MPDSFLRLAVEAAAEADYQDFTPDACLINRYEPGAQLSLHQGQERARLRRTDRLGLARTAGRLQFGGLKRTDPVAKYALRHGDVAVWGGPSRLRFHGVQTVKEGLHPKLGRVRVNLTLRRAV
jgi:alkylated DNA repair protein (DNA oxidative demethylase)